MTKKLLALISAIFIIMLLPIGTFATSDAALNDSIIVTEMEFLNDNETVLDNPSSATKKVRLECTNLYPGTKSNATIVAVAKDKTSKSLLKVQAINEIFNIGDTKRNVSIDFDLSEQSANFNNIDISFYIWSNGSIKPLSRDLTVDFETDLTDNELLYNNYNIYEVGGIIVANGNATTTGTVCAKNEIEVSCDVFTNSPFSNAQNVIFNIGNTNINDYIGKYCYIYFNINSNNEYEIVRFVEATEKSNVIKITSDMLDNASLDFESTLPYIKYYRNDSSSTEVYLSSDYIPIWNTYPQEHSYLTSNLNSFANVTVEFIDIDNDNKYDIVNAYEYIHLIAQEVNTATNKILTYNDINVVVDYELDVSITDTNGNRLTVSDISDKDVLAINIGKEGTPSPSASLLKTANYDSIDIIVLKNSFVEGTITQVADEIDSNNNLALSIDEIPYNFNTADKGAYNLIGIAVDTQGIFYIGTDGKIIGFEESAISPNYGLIMSASTDENATTLTMLTKNGAIVDYEIASSLEIVNPNTSAYIQADTNNTMSTASLAYISDTTWEGVIDNSDTLKNELCIAFAKTLDTTDAVKQRFVIYKTNQNNEIIRITPSSTEGSDTYRYDLGFEETEGEKLYDGSTNKLGKYLLSKTAIVFDIDFSNPSNTMVSDITHLKDESEYDALLYSQDSSGYYGVVVILSSTINATEPEPDNTTGANGVAIVKSASSNISETVTNVIAYQNGEEIELIFDESKYTQANSNVNPKDFAFGTVFMYNSEAGGFVTEYTVIGQTELTTSAKNFTFDSAFASSFETNIKEGEAFYHGYISMLSNDESYVDICVTSCVADGFTEGDYEAFNVASANQYSLTGTPDAPEVISDTYIYGRVDFADYDADDNLIGYNVFVRTYKNEVIDIISFDDKGHIITQ